MQELRRHEPQPELANRATDISSDITHAAGGQHSEDHPVHATLHWRAYDGTQTTETRWGLVTAWTDTAMRVHFWRHGEHWAWLPRADVEPCTCGESCEVTRPPL